MSATNRGTTRRASDYYPTPAWCTRVLIRTLCLRGQLRIRGPWLEPCAGDGSIIRAVNSVVPGVVWDAVELREESREALDPLTRRLTIGDFLQLRARKPYDVIITNPPFSLAREFVEHAIQDGTRVFMLLRVNWLSSAKRHNLFTEHPPNVYMLPHRPSFTGDGKTDATDYAWMEWPGIKRNYARISWLPLVDKAERRRVLK